MAKKVSNQPAKSDIEKQIDECAKTIGYSTNEYTVGYLASEMAKAENGEDSNFHIPGYQRMFVWEEERISKFIESIILGLPIPFLFFYEAPKTGKLEIVDGSQRLRSIKAFIYDGFKLVSLERLTCLNGKEFNDLEESRKRKFGNRSIRGIVLNEHTDDEARQDLFDRINTSSKVATPAEIRRGAFLGPFMDMIEGLAKDIYYKKHIPLTKKTENRFLRDELITRFFAYGDGLEEYENVVEDFLAAYVQRMNTAMQKNDQLRPEYEERLKRTIEYILKFPSGLGLKSKETSNRITRVRFESIAVGTWLALKEKGESGLRLDNVGLWIDSDEYKAILRSDGGNIKKKLEKRIYFVRDHLIKGE